MNAHVPFVCDLKNGIHARPASMLAEAVESFAADVTIGKEGGTPVDARSVLSVVGLDVHQGDRCIITVSGSDSAKAIDAVRRLIDGEWAAGDEHPSASAEPSGQRGASLPHGLRECAVSFVAGTPVCGGIGRGIVVTAAGLSLPASMRDAKPGPAADELAKARKAFSDVAADLRARAAAAGAAKKRFEADLLNAHAQIASDPALWIEVERRIRSGDLTAAQATVDAATRFMEQLRRAGSAYVRDRVVDIQDVAMQVIDRLRGDGEGGRAARRTSPSSARACSSPTS
jgi:fructose-specific PTS system IIA-like component